MARKPSSHHHSLETDKSRTLLKQLRAHRSAIAGIILFLSAYALTITVQFLPKEYSAVIGELCLTVALVLFVHILDHMYLSRDSMQLIHEEFEPVSRDAQNSLDRLAAASLSFAAMRSSGITQVYSGRSSKETRLDMARELTARDVKEIRLIGVSLNDFVLDSNNPLYLAFEKISKSLKGEGDPDGQGPAMPELKDVKVLLVDPYSYGAQERYRAETELPDAPRTRMQHDVEMVAKKLLELKKSVAPGRFDCRIYRTAPQLFLAWTNRCCYVQQYYYWSSRVAESTVPAMRFQPPEADVATRDGEFEPPKINMHSQMEGHFNWIWDHATVSVEEFLHDHIIGCDMGMSQADAVNVFMVPKGGMSSTGLKVSAKDRIISLLDSVVVDKNDAGVNEVELLGISLHSFFDEKNDEIRPALQRVLGKPNVTVKVICLDPESPQAGIRAYREEKLRDDPDMKEVNRADLTRFGSEEGAPKSSQLYRDTHDTLVALERLLVDKIQVKCKLQAWKYSCAPSCFMLRVNGRALFEPYTYGKLDLSDKSPTLGGDMPIFEFQAPPQAPPGKKPFELFDRIQHRNPVGLLKDHFRFISKISIPLGSTAGAPEPKAAAVESGSEALLVKDGKAFTGKFLARAIEQIPSDAIGVYCLYDDKNQLIFVGTAVGDATTIGSELLAKLSSGGPMVSNADRFSYEVYATGEEIHKRELELLRECQQKHDGALPLGNRT